MIFHGDSHMCSKAAKEQPQNSPNRPELSVHTNFWSFVIIFCGMVEVFTMNNHANMVHFAVFHTK